jgi:hypothetical protein
MDDILTASIAQQRMEFRTPKETNTEESRNGSKSATVPAPGWTRTEG